MDRERGRSKSAPLQGSVGHGIPVSCGEFSSEAQRFAEDKSIDLVDGNKMLELIAELSPEQSRELHRSVTVGDYQTPSCPSCGVTMVKRQDPQKSFLGLRELSRLLEQNLDRLRARMEQNTPPASKQAGCFSKTSLWVTLP